MELRHLRYFGAVAEQLHFGRAAERLQIEQSPLSQTIKDLESELAIRLLDRNTPNTWGTEAGAIFLGEARRALTSIERAQQKSERSLRDITAAYILGFPRGLAKKIWLGH